MGTCNLICVYYKGRYAIAQYGQLDGYPSGQGVVVYRVSTIINVVVEVELV